MIAFLALFFLVGAAIGSFLNVVVDRTTRKETILGRSYCDYCRETLKTIDLIPILSFIVLSGKCRYCGKPISWQYPAVEVVTAVLFTLTGFLVIANGDTFPNSLFYLFLISISIIVAVVDFKYYLIPTTFVFCASLVALFFNFFTLPSDVFVDHVVAAFGAGLFFAFIVAVTRGKGMGVGDIFLGFLMGMVLGVGAVVFAIFLAFTLGALVSLLLIFLKKKKFGQTMPFAPFLIAGFISSLFFAKPIVDWYLRVYLL